MRELFKGSLLLSAIGDALGWVSEFESNPESLQKKYKTAYLSEFVDWKKRVGGKFYGYTDIIKAGSYSDDTQLTLALARSIGKDGLVNQNTFAKEELANWNYYARGGGKTIKLASQKVARKKTKWNTNFFSFSQGEQKIDYRACGANGVAMRILPIALVNGGDPERIVLEIFRNGIITHGHPRALLGAMAYGCMVDAFLSESIGDAQSFLYALQNRLPVTYNANPKTDPPLAEWLELWEKEGLRFSESFEETIQELSNGIKLVTEGLSAKVSDEQLLSALGCFDKRTKGSGIATVLGALFFACKYLETPEQGILAAVNALGSDTDTIGAMVGGLFGAKWGVEIIPKRWQSLQDREYIEAIANRLASLRDGYEEELSAKQLEAPIYLKDLKSLAAGEIQSGDRFTFAPLGVGTVAEIRQEKVMVKGKKALIANVEFDIGQSCVFSTLSEE